MILLGSTGSIGVNALEIAKKFSLSVDVLVAGNNIELLNRQIKEFSPRAVVVSKKELVSRMEHTNVTFGEDAILRVIEESNSSLVVNALVGFLGLSPTLKAIECGKKVALANKESLVAGGSFVDVSKVVPIDSEHFGLWYLQQNGKKHEKMIITASGGAFRDWDIEKLQSATLSDALKHPNWSMGQKITIDSATMMNKLFELLEARWLFGEGNYDAIIETKSLIHALINFKDGSTTAHFATACMQLPIAYAITSHVDREILKPVNLVEVGTLEFRSITKERYPIWEIKDDVLKNPHRGVVLNAANEVSIEKFVSGEIGFLDISKESIKAYEAFDVRAKSVSEIFEIDKDVREYVRGLR